MNSKADPKLRYCSPSNISTLLMLQTENLEARQMLGLRTSYKI